VAAPKSIELPQAQRRAMLAILEFVEDTGNFPTGSELGAKIEMSRNVGWLLRPLEKKGYIEKRPGSKRFTVTAQAYAWKRSLGDVSQFKLEAEE